MNHSSAVLIREFEGDMIPRKKKPKKSNPLLCSALDGIGRHVPDDDHNCKYCGFPMEGMRVIS